MDLNQEQKAAVETTARRALVQAGAGSGKTRVLTSRAAHLVDSGTPPDRICCVTFTRKAANELRSRLSTMIGRNASQLTVGTFHSLCASWIRSYLETSRALPLTPDFSIYDATDSGALLEMSRAAMARQMPKSGLDRRYSWREICDESHPDRNADGFRVYADYHRRKFSMNAIDFADCLELFLHLLLLDPAVFLRHAERYQHILIDEGQDTDRLQWSLASLAIEAGKAFSGCLFVVADTRQSIYAFRGAEPQTIEALAADPDWATYGLTVNYRSTRQIVELANRIDLAMGLKSTEGKQLTALKVGGEPQVLPCGDAWNEARTIANHIRGYTEVGMRPKDIAILYRTHKQAKPLCAVFDECEIPYYRVGSERALWDQVGARQVVRLLRLACNPGDDQSFEWVCNWPQERLSPRDLAGAKADAAGAAQHMIVAAGDAVSDLRALVFDVDRDMLAAEAVACLENLIGEDDFAHAACVEIAEWNDGEATTGEFLDWFATRNLQDEMREERDAVTLCTVHASKGLEWPLVCLVGMEHGTFPIKRANTDAAEELRLFYVAVTRARSELVLSHATVAERGPMTVTVQPSPFLAFMQDAERKTA